MATLASSGHLYEANGPADFWRVIPERQPLDEEWTAAGGAAIVTVGLPGFGSPIDMARFLAQVLGEGQFGVRHWDLSRARRLYYQVKPVLPRAATRLMRRVYRLSTERSYLLRWPIEDRYVRFQWETLQKLLDTLGEECLAFIHFWPHGRRLALVLTHDIETADGQATARKVADLEEGLGFHSSFNFVPERYRLDMSLIHELSGRGFEVGVHGLKHDGKLFQSRAQFQKRVERINRHLKELGAVGFRAPLTHRNPEWMQALEIEYDLSFFDTDPYEPIPGGTMSIWPFMIGRFVELPYTLAQDYTLTAILKEKTPTLWLRKVEFLRRYFGMALVNTHPDYLIAPEVWGVYAGFLREMKNSDDYWHALPREVARWWRDRASVETVEALPGGVLSRARMSGGNLVIEPHV